MTTPELALAQPGVSQAVKRPRRSVVTLGLALLGFFVGESFGQRVDTACTSCREIRVAGAGTAVNDLNPSGPYLAHSQPMVAPIHDPWLVEAGWSGAYYAPQY